MMSEALKLARELLQAIRELTAELRQRRADEQDEQQAYWRARDYHQ